MIVYVAFQRPVNLTPGGNEFWSVNPNVTSPGLAAWTCVDKGTHLLFTRARPGKPTVRIRVPLTNIAFVTDEDDAPAKEK